MGFWRGTALEPCGRPAIVSVQEKPKMTKTHVTVWLDQKEELSKAGHCGWAPATAGVSAIASRSAKDAAKAALIPWWQEILAHENIYWNFYRGSNPCLGTGPNSFNMWAKSFYFWWFLFPNCWLFTSWTILTHPEPRLQHLDLNRSQDWSLGLSTKDLYPIDPGRTGYMCSYLSIYTYIYIYLHIDVCIHAVQTIQRVWFHQLRWR